MDLEIQVPTLDGAIFISVHVTALEKDMYQSVLPTGIGRYYSRLGPFSLR